MSDKIASSISDSHTPRVSVLVPVYNAQAYLVEALDCILAQTFTDWEMICVNDGSTDSSLTILNDYANQHARIRVIDRPNTGIVGALNDALKAAKGEYIARMDADDWCAAVRFQRQVDYLDQHKDCIAVGSYVQRTDPYGSPAGDQRPPLDHESIDAALLKGDGGALIHATLMMRREALVSIGGWDSRYDWVEDLDLFLRLTEHGRVANLPEHLYTYRRHVESVCATKNDIMYPRLIEVLRDAYARRGIDREPDLKRDRPELNGPRPSVAQMYRDWACHAIHAGNALIARKHALSALARAPLSPRSWRVLYWSLTG